MSHVRLGLCRRPAASYLGCSVSSPCTPCPSDALAEDCTHCRCSNQPQHVDGNNYLA